VTSIRSLRVPEMGVGSGIYGDSSPNELQDLLGIKGWTIDPRVCGNAHIGTSQWLHGVAVDFSAETIITNLSVYLSVAAMGLTYGGMGIYDSNFNLISQTANTPAAYQTTGWVTQPLTSTFVVPANGIYYLSDLYVGTTMPTYIDAVATIVSSQMPNGKFLWFQDRGPYNTLPAACIPISSAHPHCMIAT
jgi:hypothetical protein